MRTNRIWTHKTVAATMTALALAGCATQGDGTGPTGSDVFSGDCNPLVAGAIGTAIGALLGGGSNRVRGAAIGAGVGALACMAYNYQTRQTKSSQQVTDDYKASNKGALPPLATVSRFDAQVSPKSSVQAGSTVDVASYIEVVPGTKDPRPKVEQQITLYAPDGKEAANARKPANQNPGGGAFETNFRFTMPRGVPQGVYPVKSQVFVNGDAAANAETRFQVVVSPTGTIVAFAPLQRRLHR